MSKRSKLPKKSVFDPEYEFPIERNFLPAEFSDWEEVFDTLSENHQNVIALYDMGHTYKEISEITGLKIGTVASRLHYAKKLAEEIMEAQFLRDLFLSLFLQNVSESESWWHGRNNN